MAEQQTDNVIKCLRQLNNKRLTSRMKTQASIPAHSQPVCLPPKLLKVTQYASKRSTTMSY